MATKPKIDKEITDKRPLRLKCVGGPYPYVSVYSRVVDDEIPFKDETGNGAVIGRYRLHGATYVWERA